MMLTMRNISASIKGAPGHLTEDFKRRKHIELEFHHVREKIASGEIMVEKISSSDMAADLHTKLLTSEQIREENDQAELVDVKTMRRTAKTVQEMHGEADSGY